MNREQQVAAIVREARKTRPRTSRAMWIAAIVVGVIGVVGFALALTTEGSSRPDAQPPTVSRLGFTAGLVIGLGVGVALGLSVARQRRTRDHE